MKYTYIIPAAFALLIASCKKDVPGSLNTGNFIDSVGTLKEVASFPIGIAIDYTPFMNDAKYLQAVSREADNVTFGYQMKHGALVKDDGSINFTKSDELLNKATVAGLEVFGHTLGWHQNQNGTYLRSLTGGSAGPAAVNLIANGGFELGSGTSFTNWAAYNGVASFSAGSGGEVNTGARSLKVEVLANNPGGHWRVQFASDLFPTTVDKTYKISFQIKSATAGGSGRLSTGPTAQYQPDFTTNTSWTIVSWTITAKEAQTRILFDMGAVADTYFIDEVSIVDASIVAPPSGAEIALKVDNALKTFITTTATHYKGKVKAWDVVNEPMSDGGGALRTNTGPTTGDTFYWSQYLGRNWGLKAFQYAKAADPAALLFINDYNLESNNAKLDSLLGYVAELKTKGAVIDGIGTQMHIGVNTSYAGIENMFKKLAATGLKIRISELDVRINPTDLTTYKPGKYELAYQAAMYKHVIASYIKYIPAAQRHGVTIWGVTDADSWIVLSQKKLDFPLLFNNSYGKKPAFSAVREALKAEK